MSPADCDSGKLNKYVILTTLTKAILQTEMGREGEMDVEGVDEVPVTLSLKHTQLTYTTRLAEPEHPLDAGRLQRTA